MVSVARQSARGRDQDLAIKPRHSAKLARRVLYHRPPTSGGCGSRQIFDDLALSNITAIIGYGSFGFARTAPLIDRIIVTAAARPPRAPF